jgi:hypothetical protein
MDFYHKYLILRFHKNLNLNMNYCNVQKLI